MSVVQTNLDIDYPESDGKPMGETDLHRSWMERLFEVLRYRYDGQHVYVSSDLLVYCVEGDPHKFVVPDVFVVKDCDPGPRRVFKVWEEGAAPHVVIEVTSRSTKREDTDVKPQTYAKIGVKELFLFDPTSDYLEPPLQGFRLSAAKRTKIKADDAGGLLCQELRLRLWLDDGKLAFTDLKTGQCLPTEAEAERTAREAERAAREAAEARADAAEAELERLREQLRRQSSGSSPE